MADVLELVREERCLFWLDAHYSRGDTARGEEETPILKELELIGAHPVRGHLLLIDDARCFGVDEGYPSIERMRETAARLFPSSAFSVDRDIIRIIPMTEDGRLP